MNDERMQSLLEEEFRTLDTTPKDVESSTRRVMERKAGVRQRSRWWPFPVFYRRHDTPTATDTTDERLMPGMTVEVEIIVERVTNVLYVPVEALYRENKKLLCRVQAGADLVVREVTAGRRSDHFVEIIDGLREGEKVALQRRDIGAK